MKARGRSLPSSISLKTLKRKIRTKEVDGDTLAWRAECAWAGNFPEEYLNGRISARLADRAAAETCLSAGRLVDGLKPLASPRGICAQGLGRQKDVRNVPN